MKKYFGKSISSSMEVELRSYILEGGFPRTIYLDSIEDKRTYVQGVVKEIFDKDIRRRVKVKNKDAFDLVRKYIINNFGATTSINSICEELRKNGFAISQATVSKYIRALVDTKILYECDRFDMKSKRMLAGEKKYYLSDLSFYFSQNTDNQINFGPVLENIVYVYARSQDCEVSIGRFGKFECDFIVRNKELEYAYIQVAYTILASKDTEDREYRPLETVKDNYPKFIMTTDFLIQKRNGIKHVNLMEFMCDGQTF
jgi:predicted AAA+ superfamily ATPase